MLRVFYLNPSCPSGRGVFFCGEGLEFWGFEVFGFWSSIILEEALELQNPKTPKLQNPKTSKLQNIRTLEPNQSKKFLPHNLK